MSDSIGTEELALLAASFEGAVRAASSPADLDAALFGLGWGDVLDASPAAGAAIAFAALGSSGATAGLLDDVMASALGLDAAPDVGIVLPAPVRSAPPGRRFDDSIVVDGIVSTRIGRARPDQPTTIWLPTTDDSDVLLVRVARDSLAIGTAPVLDPDVAYQRVECQINASHIDESRATTEWESAVTAARVALAHQLIAGARTMLAQAREHAVERVQFGRAVGSFQAVRHKLAESLAQIEGAAAVADVCDDGCDPLLAALAKSLAGGAARTTAANAQQVLAGIGFTTDHPFQRWMKRALTIDAILGSATSLPAEIGTELLVRGDAPRLVEL